MNKGMKEIIKLCTTGKMAEFLKNKWLPSNRELTDYVYDSYGDNVDYVGNYNNGVEDGVCWLPLSYDTKHNCLQVETLIKNFLKIKETWKFNDKFFSWNYSLRYEKKSEIRDKYYVLQCLIWLKELVEKEGK